MGVVVPTMHEHDDQEIGSGVLGVRQIRVQPVLDGVQLRLAGICPALIIEFGVTDQIIAVILDDVEPVTTVIIVASLVSPATIS